MERQAMNYANGLQTGTMKAPSAAPQAVNPSCFGTIECAASNVAQLTSRVLALVDRLAGSVPEKTGESALKNTPNGLLNEGMERARAISEYTAVMNAALDRLEKSLP